MLAELSSISLSTAMLMDSLSNVFSSNTAAPNQKPDVASQVYSQICHIIRADGHYIHHFTSRYFRGVHRWLPIISRNRFNKRLGDFGNAPSADFSILLLTIRLITQHPSRDSGKDQDREVLYIATKTLFAQVQSYAASSLSMVQASILLATYEHGHGMIEAAYITIGTAARMAFAAGLHNKQCFDEPRSTDEWTEEEEALSTWWGLVICDRQVSHIFV